MPIQGMMKELNGRTIEHIGFSEIYGIPAFRTVGINLTIGGLGRAIGNRQLAMPRLSQFGPPHASRDRFCTTMGSRKASYQVIKLQQVREPNRQCSSSFGRGSNFYSISDLSCKIPIKVADIGLLRPG
jgi:hypothetical protein